MASNTARPSPGRSDVAAPAPPPASTSTSTPPQPQPQWQRQTRTQPSPARTPHHTKHHHPRWKKPQRSPSDWWFASTAIPLLAATLGPLANVSSIAALVTSWRQTTIFPSPDSSSPASELNGIPLRDPRWCYDLNIVSLVVGFLGNFFLLLNFTQRIRYVVALPATIACWYLAAGILVGITVAMEVCVPPDRPGEGWGCADCVTDTQGYWYAVAAAVFYAVCSLILMVNMLGYFRGHYPDHFALSDSQRTLILQTMAFFIWLAGGAGVYAQIEGWSFADSLYFCDVTILTVGFGDLVPKTDAGRGIVFPYSVGGIITLALIVSSLYRAARELSQENIVQKHTQQRRERALELTVTNSSELRHRELDLKLNRRRTLKPPKISAPSEPRPFRTPMGNGVRHAPSFHVVRKLNRAPRLILLKEEKDRFAAMRRIQADSKRFKRWMALVWSVATFTILWCVGAVVFWRAERSTQGLTYFQSLYFCYVSLLTVGYGDLAPKSNAGRCFFVIWSLIAVPTMTILVSDLGDTVVAKFKKWSSGIADFTVLPKEGAWRTFLNHHPALLARIQRRVERHAAKRRLEKGFETTDPGPPGGDVDDPELSLPALATETEADDTAPPPPSSLSHALAQAIQRTARDQRTVPPKRYKYEEWVEFTRLIRLTTAERLNQCLGGGSVEDDDGDGVEREGDEGMVNWDWIGEDSPMVSGVSEAAWVCDRLCESLVRLEGRRERVDSGRGSSR